MILTNPVRKTFSALCLLAFTVGALSRLSAQTEGTVGNMAFPSAPLIQTAAPNRVYVGTVTRTGDAGKTAKGDILLSVTPAGEVTANLTMNGKVHAYFGRVSVRDHGPVASAHQTKERSGTLRALHAISTSPTDGSLVVATTELPLTITTTSAYGGATDRNGSSFVFTASRINLAAAASGLPVGVTPVSGGPVGIIVGTVPGGG